MSNCCYNFLCALKCCYPSDSNLTSNAPNTWIHHYHTLWAVMHFSWSSLYWPLCIHTCTHIHTHGNSLKQKAFLLPLVITTLPGGLYFPAFFPYHATALASILINTSVNSSIIEFLLDWLPLSQANCLSTLIQMNPHWTLYWLKIVIRRLSSTQLYWMSKTVCRYDLDGRYKSFEIPNNLSLSLRFIAVNKSLSICLLAISIHPLLRFIIFIALRERTELVYCRRLIFFLNMNGNWFGACLFWRITGHFHLIVILDFLLLLGWMALGVKPLLVPF